MRFLSYGGKILAFFEEAASLGISLFGIGV
jgi:hypothetical protein